MYSFDSPPCNPADQSYKQMKQLQHFHQARPTNHSCLEVAKSTTRLHRDAHDVHTARSSQAVRTT